MAGYFDLGSLSPSAQSESGTRAAYDNYQGYENSTGLEFGPQIMRRAGGYQTDVSRDGMIDTKEEGFGLYRDMVIASGRTNREIGQGNQESGKANAFGIYNPYRSVLDTNMQTGTFGGIRLSGFRTLGGDPNRQAGFSVQRQPERAITTADDYRNSVALSGALGVASRNTGAGSLGYNSNMSADYLRRAYSLTRPGQSAVAGASWANNALGGGAAGLGNYRFGLM